jgi:hypothetical protein
MSEKESACGCGCALKQETPKATKDKEEAKEPKEKK